jgi:hypothetical protein
MEREVPIPAGERGVWLTTKRQTWYEVNPGTHLEFELVLKSAAALREAEVNLMSAKYRESANTLNRRKGVFIIAVDIRVKHLNALHKSTLRLGFRSFDNDVRVTAKDCCC